MTTAMATPDISVVIAAFNEATNIAPMCAALKEVLGPLGRHEVIFVEDGSTDGTLDAIRAAAARDPAVRYVSLTRNFGHQTCLRAGLRHARGRAVVVMDADFEHPPELLPELIAQWRSGHKVVTTRRIDEGETSWFKRASSNLYYRILNALGDVHIEPGSADYLLIDRMAVDAVNAIEDHELFLRGAVRWFGYPLATVPYRRGTRTEGVTKYSLRRLVELAVTGIAAHSIRPLRFAIWLSLGFAAVGALLILYSIASFFFVERTVVGWTSLMAALAILGAVQLLVLGIIGEYVGRILRETRKRPHYVIAETEADRREADRVARLTRQGD